MMKRIATLIPVLTLVLLIPACGGDDDGDGGGGGGDGLHGVYFDGGNAPTMAGHFAQTLDFMMGVSQAVQELIDAAVAAAGGTPAPALDQVDLGDIGLCDSGASLGSWNDVDNDGALSAGDVLSLALTNCDNVTHGSLALTFAEFSATGGVAAVDLTVTFVDEVNQATVTTVIDGHFTTEVTAQGNLLAFRHEISNNGDANQRIIMTVDGTRRFTLGCFNLYFMLDTNTGFTTVSEPLAVFSVPDQGVMSVASYGSQYVMVFDPNGVPLSGQLEFAAESFALPCASLGVPTGGVDSNDSQITLTAIGGGQVTLTGHKADGSTFTTTVAWNDIN